MRIDPFPYGLMMTEDRVRSLRRDRHRHVQQEGVWRQPEARPDGHRRRRIADLVALLVRRVRGELRPPNPTIERLTGSSLR